ncbi:neuronal acetylcholine receptor subunit alpha-10-like isoform X2 [Haliotis rufescens]|uniref:neuronal acetylcholine receptor subunit alpha-10-like isoform X2 n=1 Tax=Haliotis rufescens TaxID=6454 RepID=UPI00201EF32F|nr:neuronal acetylcholine receptor subunit alpha-10-like isoform X2 [Haliotis rufescens]
MNTCRKTNWFVSVIVVSGWMTGVLSNQTALLDKVFTNYHSDVRPICGTDAPIEVKIGIAIRQVIELDEPKQILTINAWLRLNWYDCQFTWNATEYGGISSLILPYAKVWTPDITLYDNAGDELAGLKDYRPVINSDGSASYNFPTIIQSLCKVDVTYFPFDTQTCALKFGSWAYHGLQVNSTNRASAGDMSNFKVNTEWDLVSVPVERHVVYYGCCPEPYPDVTFYVNLRRKPLFYTLNLLFPCILITTVALLGFLLPPDSGEKVSLEITVLLSLAVFLLVVSETLPPTSENFPLIGIYFCLSMMLVTFSTVLTVLVLNVHFKGQHGIGVPRWVRSLFLETIAPLLCVKKEMAVHPIKMAVNGDLDLFLQDHATKYLQSLCRDDQDDLNKTNQNGVNRFDSRETEVHDLRQSSPLQKVMKEQLAVLKKINTRYAEKHKFEAIGEEWKKVAIVMDRLFLVVFFLLSVIVTLGILLQCVNSG